MGSSEERGTSESPQSSYIRPLDYDAIIFDLGGVLVDLDVPRTVMALGQLFQKDAQAFYTQARQAELFDRFECGLLSAAEFREQLRSLFSSAIDTTDEAIDNAWNALLGHVPSEKLQLLKGLRQSKRVFLLSNTNEIHIEAFLASYDATHLARFGPWRELFEQVHYSHLLGFRKPDLRAFRALLTMHRLQPARTVFIDDNADNIRAAQQLGLQTRYHRTNESLDPYFVHVASSAMAE